MRFRNVFPRKADSRDLAEIDSIFEYFQENAEQYNETVYAPPLTWEDLEEES